jgi:hypothetical protein
MSHETFTTMILKARSAAARARLQHIASVAPQGAEPVFGCLGQSEWGGIESVTLNGDDLSIHAWCQATINPTDEVLAAPPIPSVELVCISDYTHSSMVDCVIVGEQGAQCHAFEFQPDESVDYTHAERIQELSFEQAVSVGEALHPLLGERIQNLGCFIFGYDD